MTPDPGHVSADPDVQDGPRDLKPANAVIEMPVTAVVEPAIRADERLRFLEAAKDFPEPYRTIIARTASREP